MSEQQNKEAEIDLVDLARKIWGKRKFIIRYCIIGAVAGLVVGFSMPGEYTSGVKMAPEEKNNPQGGNMAGLAAMAGINIGASGNDGIKSAIYPEVIKSTPFLVEMSQIMVERKRESSPKTLYDYIENDISSPWWSYVVSAPFKLIGLVMGRDENDEIAAINPQALTLQQSRIIESLGSRIALVSDKKSGILTVSTTFQDPRVAAIVADSLVRKLEAYVINYHTGKAKQDLEFIQKMYDDSKDNYYTAQANYAQLMDRSQNVIRESVKIEQEKLRNEQNIAYGVYNQMAQQLEAAKMKVQEVTPVLTIIEPASVPNRKSSTGKATYLIAFTFLAGLLAVGIVVGKELIPGMVAK